MKEAALRPELHCVPVNKRLEMFVITTHSDASVVSPDLFI